MAEMYRLHVVGHSSWYRNYQPAACPERSRRVNVKPALSGQAIRSVEGSVGMPAPLLQRTCPYGL